MSGYLRNREGDIVFPPHADDPPVQHERWVLLEGAALAAHATDAALSDSWHVLLNAYQEAQGSAREGRGEQRKEEG